MARYYLVVRVRNNGREDEITRLNTANYSDEQIRTLREAALGDARLMRTAQQWNVKVYGPTEDDNPPTADDVIWSSETDL